MQPYRVTVEVTTTYTVEVHAEDDHDARDRAWKMDPDEIEAQGSAESTKVTYVAEEEIEAIQQEMDDE